MEKVDDLVAMGERLKWARQQAGFKSGREAALECDWPESTYRSHENGTRGFKIDMARKYARKFEVNPIWLFSGDGSPHASKDNYIPPAPTTSKDEKLKSIKAILLIATRNFPKPLNDAQAAYLASTIVRVAENEKVDKNELLTLEVTVDDLGTDM